jgi:MFS transporter, DHA1 family, multidrug resistance protein
MHDGRRAAHPGLVLGLLVAGTVLGLAGTDLVLPAIPSLPERLGGDVVHAQFVIAAYVAGTAAGLLAFGALGDRFATRALLVTSLLGTALAAFACALARDIDTLIGLRALQGAVAAGPAVFAPGIVKALFDERGAVRALGALGSIEALAPAVAPVFGAWLLVAGGWQLSFHVLGVAALLVALLVAALAPPLQLARRERGSYRRLLGNAEFLRHALAQAFVLGGLLTFVFGMPVVFVRVFGGTLGHFITMQVAGIACFMLAANTTGRLVQRHGAERIILAGTAIAVAAALALLAYGLAGGRSPLLIAALFVPLNGGLGLRGPPGFYRAVVAARGDDARGAALVILAILSAAALGTAVAAPLLTRGLVPLAAITAAFEVLALLCLTAIPGQRPAPGAPPGSLQR